MLGRTNGLVRLESTGKSKDGRSEPNESIRPHTAASFHTNIPFVSHFESHESLHDF